MTSPAELSTVTLRVVSPCEHGIEHDILELIDGAEFSFPQCKNGRGIPRLHVSNKDNYPKTVRRR